MSHDDTESGPPSLFRQLLDAIAEDEMSHGNIELELFDKGRGLVVPEEVHRLLATAASVVLYGDALSSFGVSAERITLLMVEFQKSITNQPAKDVP